MTVTELDAFLRAELPHAFRYDALSIERADGRTCRIRQGFHESMLRPGGTVSGPTLMALAREARHALQALIAPAHALNRVLVRA